MEIDGITKGPSLYYVSKMTGVRKMVIFADDYLGLRRVGGSEKVQKCADVI